MLSQPRRAEVCEHLDRRFLPNFDPIEAPSIKQSAEKEHPTTSESAASIKRQVRKTLNLAGQDVIVQLGIYHPGCGHSA